MDGWMDGLTKRLGCLPAIRNIHCSLFILLLLSKLSSGHTSSFEPQHHCKLLPHETANESIPLEPDGKGGFVFDRCYRYNDTMDFSSHELKKWNTSPRKANRSIVPCDRGWDYINSTDGMSWFRRREILFHKWFENFYDFKTKVDWYFAELSK